MKAVRGTVPVDGPIRVVGRERALLIALAVALVLTGCASTTGGSETRATEQMLTSVGRTTPRADTAASPPEPTALVVGAQGTSALYGAWALAHWFRVSWEPRSEGGAPSIGGWVYNNSTLRVTNVRLRVEGLDDAHGTVAETFTWAQGDIIPRGRTYFVAPTLPGAATYRISVVSFDAVSLGH